eukprot:4673918-Amphidinium_carterae.2
MERSSSKQCTLQRRHCRVDVQAGRTKVNTTINSGEYTTAPQVALPFSTAPSVKTAQGASGVRTKTLVSLKHRDQLL